MMLGPYANFIVTSYAMVGALIAALIVWIASDYRAQTRKLRELDRSGVTRLSGRNAAELR